MQFFIIGIDDNREQFFSPKIESIIHSNSVFSGGLRHQEIMTPYLPTNHKWIPITVPLDNVFNEYKKEKSVVVFASGDPLFYGFANTILKRLPDSKIELYPQFNSLQLLAHRLLLPYHTMRVVSLTGRPWEKLDEALINGEELIGVLTDKKLHTPSTIAQRMIQYGYSNYTAYIGELLGNSEKESVSKMSLEEMADKTFSHPNNLILERTYKKYKQFGIQEKDFFLLDGREKMITKAPIRLLSLSLLELHNKSVFWDIGYCTGSVSIEAKLQFPHLDVIAFEKRERCEEILNNNCVKFGTPGIRSFIGDFTTLNIPSSIPRPDAVFIGGHGGKMDEIFAKISSFIKDNGTVVFNSVSEQSKSLFTTACDKYGFSIERETLITVDKHNPITVLKAIKQ